ncbi:MAG: hypothetical protein Kow0080_23910 [Candidatus Promineifilaceae bacterium]
MKMWQVAGGQVICHPQTCKQGVGEMGNFEEEYNDALMSIEMAVSPAGKRDRLGHINGR